MIQAKIRSSGRIAATRRKLRDFAKNKGGMALVEFAMASPIFLALGFSALELANYAVTSMRISQIGMNVADNISRVGTVAGPARQRVFESDIEDSFQGAQIQGSAIRFAQQGRIIVSSLQTNAAGGQWIAWQRCYGAKNFASSYGIAGNGRTVNTFAGMGPTGDVVTSPTPGNLADPDTGVVFVEIAYDYKAIVEPIARGLAFFGLRVDGQLIRYKQAFIVRNSRQMGRSGDTVTAAEDYGLFQNATVVPRRTPPGSPANPNYTNNC